MEEREIIIVPKRSSWMATVLNGYSEPSTNSASSTTGSEGASAALHDEERTSSNIEVKRVDHEGALPTVVRSLMYGPQFALPDYPEDGGDMSGWIPYIEADIVAMDHDLMAVMRKWGPEMFRYHEYCIKAERMAIKDAKEISGSAENTLRKAHKMNEAAARLTRLHANMNRIWNLLEPPQRAPVN